MANSVWLVTIEDGVIVRNHIDMVGQDLSCQLQWCATHLEPVWVYKDGSYECPFDRSTEVRHDDHVIGNLWHFTPDST